MGDEVVQRAAKRLWEAEQTATPIQPLSDEQPPITRESAYDVQLAVAALRKDLGHQVVGKKIGLTSAAMQQMVGVDEPDYGHLFAAMAVDAGGTIPRAALIAPRVEPELAFVLSRPLPGARTRPADVLRCTEYVTAAIEVVDSRVVDWKIRWADTVADNGSSCRFVLSEQAVSPLGIDYEAIGTVLRHNGKVATTATMAEVLGSPLRSIAWLARKLGELDLELEAGDVILPGSPCRAVDAAVGDEFAVTIDHVGSATVSFA